VILIDTNVFSQPTRQNGHRGVIRWIDEHFDDLLVPTLAVSELLFGGYRLPEGKERDRLMLAHEAILLRFAGKFVDFDLPAAKLHGALAGEAARVGRTLAPSDSLIASIALTRGLAVATRNRKHFEPVGVNVIDPWTD
jgi:predicted nucleic acid-binding protein